ncbi:hypothetical protein M9H77_17279 [Catharanthus roseus]|uniref:Uncharacterized protein n=1 Tax=Catharanthus roseus TaxID=4058 RepID=A0ACC0B441_CATRO|nr:hypothetical protein M9H77_17279 [Catharanthus roseus]
MDNRFRKRKGDYERYYDSYNYGGYNYRRSSQTMGTTSRSLTYNNSKLPLLCRPVGPYDYEAREQEVESLFYSYCVREEEKFQLVLTSLPYELKVWWDSKCETNSFFASELLCLQNFGDSSEGEDGKLAYMSMNYDFEVMNNASIESIVVGFELDVSFEGFQVGANMVQAIQDWLISKSAFEKGSLYGFTSFNKKFIKDLSTIASLLVDVPEKISNHDVVNANNKKLGMKRLVFDPGGLGADLSTNLFKGGADDINRKRQEPMDVTLGPTTRTQKKKLKILEANEVNGMVVYMKKALKNKFGDQGKATLVGQGHPTVDGRPAPAVAGRLLPVESLEFTHLPPMG